MADGQPCLLWLSGRTGPGVHALGTVDRTRQHGPRTARWCRCGWSCWPTPSPGADLLADPRMRDAEVLRMPAGSNPSWLSAGQFAAVLDRVGRPARLGRWGP